MGNLILGALLCACLLASCAKAGNDAAKRLHPWSTAGHLRIGIEHAPTSLDPILARNSTDAMLDRLVFSELTTVSADGRDTLPDLAAEVPTEANAGISGDGLTITYKLRTDVKWQDGVPFTSKDVQFTWSAIMNPANKVASRVGYEDIERVETPDDATVVFYLKHKYVPFVDTVFGESAHPIGILPEHLLGKYKNLNATPFDRAPVGTGPFKIEKSGRDARIAFVANETYFRGKPKLRTIEVRTLADAALSVKALRQHEIDWMFDASPQLYGQLKNIPNLKLIVNSAPRTLNVLINNAHPPLNDRKARQAIAWSLNKQELVDRITSGLAQVAKADQPIFSWAYERNVQTYPTDLENTKRLLKEIGFTRGADGIVRKNGVPLVLAFSYDGADATQRAVAMQMQTMLKSGGIGTTLMPTPATVLSADFARGGPVAVGNYDLSLTTSIAGFDPDDHALFSCDQFPPKGRNTLRYCSKAMDGAQREALNTYDRAARKIAYSKIQKILAVDLPEIFIWYPRQLQPTNPDFKGFSPNPVNEAWNAYQWEI